MNRLSATLAALALAPAPALAQCTQDDVHEPNDTCASATPITSGFHHSLVLQGLLSAGGANDDYYRITVGQGETLEVFVDAYPFNSIGTVHVYDAACATPVASGPLATTLRVVSAAAASVWYVHVQPDPQTSFGCVPYTMLARTFLDPCPALVPDAFEENDAYTSPAVLPRGIHSGLTVSADDPDFYVIPALVGARVHVTIASELSGTHAPAATARFFDPATGNAIGVPFTSGTQSQMNLTQGPWLGLRVETPAPFDCNRYELVVDAELTPCVLAPDAFEPNDAQAAAVPIVPGLHTSLNLNLTDPDYYRFELPAGEAAIVDVTWEGSPSPVYMRAYVYPYWEYPELIGERRRLLVRNSTPNPHTVYVQCSLDNQSDPLAPCASYELRLERDEIGTYFCPATPNSTGVAATIQALGSTDPADDRLGLFGGNAPPGTYGIFFYGSQHVQVPLGGGLLCVGGSTVRLTDPIWSGFQALHWVDFQSPAAAPLTAGSTWSFQFWFRDGASYDFSDAVELTFR